VLAESSQLADARWLGDRVKPGHGEKRASIYSNATKFDLIFVARSQTANLGPVFFPNVLVDFDWP
jgi:hypothetical protein